MNWRCFAIYFLTWLLLRSQPPGRIATIETASQTICKLYCFRHTSDKPATERKIPARIRTGMVKESAGQQILETSPCGRNC
jgi:hypothetical protein